MDSGSACWNIMQASLLPWTSMFIGGRRRSLGGSDLLQKSMSLAAPLSACSTWLSSDTVTVVSQLWADLGCPSPHPSPKLLAVGMETKAVFYLFKYVIQDSLYKSASTTLNLLISYLKWRWRFQSSNFEASWISRRAWAHSVTGEPVRYLELLVGWEYNFLAWA